MSFSGGSHVTDNDDELSAVTLTFSGGPSGAKRVKWDDGKIFLVKFKTVLIACVRGGEGGGGGLEWVTIVLNACQYSCRIIVRFYLQCLQSGNIQFVNILSFVNLYST